QDHRADPWPADHRREGHGAQGPGRAEGGGADAGVGDEREGVARGGGCAGGLSRGPRQLSEGLYRVPEIVTLGRLPGEGESDSRWRTKEVRHVGSDTLTPGFSFYQGREFYEDQDARISIMARANAQAPRYSRWSRPRELGELHDFYACLTRCYPSSLAI